MADLAGGQEALLATSRASQATEDHQWAAKRVDYLTTLNPLAAAPKEINADAFEVLAA